MRRVFVLLACLLMVVASTHAGLVAASEAMPIGTDHLAAWGHAPGDADEVSSDADKGVPHHHVQCHNHDLCVEPSAATQLDIAAPRLPIAFRSIPLAPSEARSFLRPPIA